MNHVAYVVFGHDQNSTATHSGLVASRPSTWQISWVLVAFPQKFWSRSAISKASINVLPLAAKEATTLAERHPYAPGSGGISAAISQFRKSFPATVNAETLKQLGI